jgi:hypothetical protein
MDLTSFLRNSEQRFYDFNTPWSMTIIVLGFLCVSVDPHGNIEVDDELRTNVPGIWAMGDCNGKGAFTHTAYNDYEIVAANILDKDPRRVSDRIPAYALYIDPPLQYLHERSSLVINTPIGNADTHALAPVGEGCTTDG